MRGQLDAWQERQAEDGDQSDARKRAHFRTLGKLDAMLRK